MSAYDEAETAIKASDDEYQEPPGPEIETTKTVSFWAYVYEVTYFFLNSTKK